MEHIQNNFFLQDEETQDINNITYQDINYNYEGFCPSFLQMFYERENERCEEWNWHFCQGMEETESTNLSYSEEGKCWQF